MEAQKLLTMITLVTFMALVSLVMSRPQEGEESIKQTETSKMDNEEVPAEENDVCRSDVCRGRATLIKEHLNNDTDPCEDFYGYVCDKWINNHTTNGSYDSFKMLQDKYLKTIAETLQRMQHTHSPQEVIDKPAVLYESCLGFTEKDQLDDMLEIMNSSNFKEWPVITQTTDQGEMFSNASEVLLNIGMSPLINFYVSRKIQGPATYGIQIIPLGIKDLPEPEYIYKAVRSVTPDIADSDLKNITDGFEYLQRQWTTTKQSAATPALLEINTTENLEKKYTKASDLFFYS